MTAAAALEAALDAALGASELLTARRYAAAVAGEAGRKCALDAIAAELDATVVRGLKALVAGRRPGRRRR